MKKVTALRICNWSLLCLTILILASGLQLEINPYGKKIWVWLHIILGVLYVGAIFWHLKLNRRPRASSRHARQHHSHSLGLLFLLTLISGIIATAHWIVTHTHATIGGIHGKIGFLMLIAVFLHIRRHLNYYLPKRTV